MADDLDTATSDDSAAGLAWQEARRLLLDDQTAAAVELLEAHRDTGHRSILIDLASFAADSSRPLDARALLEAAGVDVDVDLDAPFDPLASNVDLGTELAEEIAPYAAIRPKPMAARNDRCPCGSGKKYKQCHLGNELHSLEHRAGWLYLKMMRYAQFTRPGAVDAIAAALLDGVESEELAEALNSSMIPADLALHEGELAAAFVAAKATLLPPDELELARSWIQADRSVYEVVRANLHSMDMIDVATRERKTVLGTASDQPAPIGVTMCGRLLRVGDSFQAYGGFLPIDPDLLDGVVLACQSHDLDTVILAMSQVFDAAGEVDEYQQIMSASGGPDLSALGDFDAAPDDRAPRAAEAALHALDE